jgi:hypothetical protein
MAKSKKVNSLFGFIDLFSSAFLLDSPQTPEQRFHPLEEREQGSTAGGVQQRRIHQLPSLCRSGVVEAGGSNQVGGAGRGRQGGLRHQEVTAPERGKL